MLKQQLKTIAQQNPSFSQPLLKLAQKFKADEIENLLNQHLAEVSSPSHASAITASQESDRNSLKQA